MEQPFLVNDVLQYKTQGSVLDLGCGIGDQSIFLAKNGFQVTAVDNDASALQKLRERSETEHVKIEVLNHSVATFQPTKSFDVILALWILHFLNAKEVPQVIARIQEHTNPSGINVILVHTDKNPPNHRPYLFKEGEVKLYYDDWTILRHVQGPGTRTKAHRTIFIAQKPKI